MAAVVVGGGGCPDPCTFFGGGCNVASDCAAGQVCRLTRAFDAQKCSEVEGRCVTPTATNGDGEKLPGAPCGTATDCAEHECCDPVTNRCVVDADYAAGDGCDARTCRDCATTAIGARCALANSTCGDGAVCAETATNHAGNGEGVCRPACAADAECAGVARCVDQGNGQFCGVPQGSPCQNVSTSLSDDRVCFGETCVGVDARGRDVAPYCTVSCDAENQCLGGFSCDAAKDECLHP